MLRGYLDDYRTSYYGINWIRSIISHDRKIYIFHPSFYLENNQLSYRIVGKLFSTLLRQKTIIFGPTGMENSYFPSKTNYDYIERQRQRENRRGRKNKK